MSVYVSCHVCHSVLTSADGMPCYSLTVCECVCQLSCMSLCSDLYWWYAILLFNCVWVCMSAVMMSLCPDLHWWYAMLLFNCVWVCVSSVMYVPLPWPLLVVHRITRKTVCECVCQLSCMSLCSDLYWWYAMLFFNCVWVCMSHCPDLYWWYAILLFNCVWVCMSAVMYVTLSWPLLMVCHVTLRLYVREYMYVTLSWHLVTYWWLVYHVSLRLCVSVCMYVTLSWYLVTYWWYDILV